MPYLKLFGVPHFYRMTSAPRRAATLVWIHGWLLSHHYWAPVCEILRDRYSCLTYDLRGFGRSNQGLESRQGTGCKSSSLYSLGAYADDLGELLAALDLKSVWLVGHSLGGSIALWAAQKFPEQVQGVVCVNAGGGIYLPTDFNRFRQVGTQLVQWRSPWLAHIPMLDWGFARMMVAKPLTRQWGAQRLQDFVGAHPEAALNSLLTSTTEEEVHCLPRILASLQQPVYFVAGAKDQVMAARYVQHLASFHHLFHTSLSNVIVLPDCGHMAMVEQPEPLANCIQNAVQNGVVSASIHR